MWALEQLLILSKSTYYKEVKQLPVGLNEDVQRQLAGSIPAARTSGRCDRVVPVEGQPPKWRDGLRKVRLVMDIK